MIEQDHTKKIPSGVNLIIAVLSFTVGILAAVMLGIYLHHNASTLMFVLYALFAWEFVVGTVYMLCSVPLILIASFFTILFSKKASGEKSSDSDSAVSVNKRAS